MSACLMSCGAYHRHYRRDFQTQTLTHGASDLSQPALQERKDRVHEVYQSTLRLAHVECDDQGGFWEAETKPGDPPSRLKHGLNQLDFLEQEVRQDLRQNPARYRNGAVLFTFVHGWNNNAKEGNDNLRDFRQAAQTLWNAEQKGQKRPVIAIYLSWRGRAMPNSSTLGIQDAPVISFIGNIPHYLSFWNRKATAEKLGYRAAAETLKRLSLLRTEIEALEPVPDHQKNSRLVVVGHSFGATAVFSAVSRFFEDELIELAASSERRKARPYIRRQWDLIALVNPAFESLRFVTLARYTRDKRLQDLAHTGSAPLLAMPRMIIVQSDNDVPNRRLFPTGQFLGNATMSTQNTPRLDQRSRLYTSLGFYTDFATHRLTSNPSCPTCPAILSELKPGSAGGERISAHLPLRISDTGRPGVATAFEKSQVVQLGQGGSLGPIIVAQADQAVVDGHTGIWRGHFLEFFIRLLEAREDAVQAAFRQ